MAAIFEIFPDPKWHPLPESEEREMIREYIQESRNVRNNNSPTTEEDINIMFALTRAFKTVRQQLDNYTFQCFRYSTLLC